MRKAGRRYFLRRTDKEILNRGPECAAPDESAGGAGSREVKESTDRRRSRREGKKGRHYRDPTLGHTNPLSVTLCTDPPRISLDAQDPCGSLSRSWS
jgi:hypothetical protein